MSEEKRAFSESSTSFKKKLDGHIVIVACYRCSKFGSYISCAVTGEEIRYPVSGPVGDKCPLPEYEEKDDEPGHE